MGTLVHPCRVNLFKKSCPRVMDDLEPFYSIIEQLTPN
jgi:hypothetical protein